LSTTSVLPSQWPIESPIKQADILAQVRTPVQVDDAAGVVVIVQNHDRPFPLQKLEGVVVVFALKQTGQRATRI